MVVSEAGGEGSCLPYDDEHPGHPRHGALRTAGRLAAYELTGLAALFGSWILADAALTGIATLRGRTRRLVRRFA